jgi:hypothetical protein
MARQSACVLSCMWVNDGRAFIESFSFELHSSLRLDGQLSII